MAELVLVLIGCGAAWAAGLLLWPYSRCTRCGGSGKNSGSTGRRWGDCRKCRGTGKRQRPGSRLVRRAAGRKRGRRQGLGTESKRDKRREVTPR